MDLAIKSDTPFSDDLIFIYVHMHQISLSDGERRRMQLVQDLNHAETDRRYT
jgi:hypothetical protein